MYCLKPKVKTVPQGDWFCSDCKPKERVRSPKKKVRQVFSSVEDTEDDEESADDKPVDSNDEEPPVDDDDEDYKNYRNIKKKKSKAKKKILEDSPEPAPKKKKGGIANLLGKRRAAAGEGEQKRREEEEEIEEEEERGNSRRSGRSRGTAGKIEEVVVESRSKRRRGELDDDIELQFSVSGLNDLIDGMLGHKDGWPFDRPITKSDAPDYHRIIKNPIDLGTIKSRLNDLKYSCNQEVLDDIRLMFNNCYQYNLKTAEEYGCGERLQKYFNKEVSKMGLSEVTETETAPPKSKKRNRRTF